MEEIACRAERDQPLGGTNRRDYRGGPVDLTEAHDAPSYGAFDADGVGHHFAHIGADMAEHFAEDMPFLDTCFGSKRCNGWIAVMGDGGRKEIEAAN